MQFVWLYWHGGAQSDELRWSMRSVLANYTSARPRFMVIGDPPPWYTGPKIFRHRVGPCSRRGFRDTLNKLYLACTSSQVDDKFVWMMDDIYFLKPIVFRNLRKHYYGGRVPMVVRSKGGWHNLKRDTARVITQHNKVPIDYCTHLPHIIDKWRFLSIWDKYGLDKRVLQWELLYGAEFFVKRRKVTGRVRARIRKKGNVFTNQTFGNNTNGGWSPKLREQLKEKFPNPTPYEKYGPKYPDIKI